MGMCARIASASLLCSALCSCGSFDPLVREAHEAVLRELKDPASAKFDDASVQIFPKEGLVCGGRVNAKNSYGGYDGFENYFYSKSLGIELGLTSVSAPVYAACHRATYEHIAATYKGLGSPVPSDVSVELSGAPRDAATAHADNETTEVKDAGLAADKAAAEAARDVDAPPPKRRAASRFPYKTSDGVDITNEADERNWKKYGTTDPDGGE